MEAVGFDEAFAGGAVEAVPCVEEVPEDVLPDDVPEEVSDDVDSSEAVSSEVSVADGSTSSNMVPP